VVDGVFAHTKDDYVAIKSGGDYPADQPTDNIRIQNCVFWNSIWGNAIENAKIRLQNTKEFTIE
jgi:polygalacturonase